MGSQRVRHDLATELLPLKIHIGEGNGNPLQYSCLENSMGRGARLATVHGVARVGHDLATEQQPCAHLVSLEGRLVSEDARERVGTESIPVRLSHRLP